MPTESSTYRRLSFWGVLALVGLRVLVGWHFYMEGVNKVREGNFSSTGFLNAAKGPWSAQFHAMVPDYDGKLRLNRQSMIAAYENYLEQARKKYRFNDEWMALASKVKDETVARWDTIANEFSAQIKEYNQGFDRIATMTTDPKYQSGGLKSQRDEIETKWRGLVKPALAAIDKNGLMFENGLHELAKQAKTAGSEPLPFELGNGSLSVRTIDKIIPIFDMVVGILLILGLLTPLAGLAAGLFLASVVLSQFPGFPGTQPTYFQAIEMMACFVLVFTDAGRYAGLDFFPWAFWKSKASKK